MIDKSWNIGSPVFEADQVCPKYKVWPWNGHRLFAYDLVGFLNPSLLVELGTYWGGSFYSFCQSVKDFQLKTKCIAVDTWRGDDHTGSYEDTVFETVQKIKAEYFTGLDIRLIRSLFSEAVEHFDDSSIDLLHIDGLHTYEAVKEDFETWLPKLAENSVVLFHDIAESSGYGSAKYWQEISSVYDSFTFEHSWGLGVLFPKGSHYYALMQKNNFHDKIRIYEYCSEMNLTKLQYQDTLQWNDRQDALIKAHEKEISELRQHLHESELRLKRMEENGIVKILNRSGFFR